MKLVKFKNKLDKNKIFRKSRGRKMFYAVDVLVNEHDYILKFANAMKKKCVEVLENNEMDTDIFRKALDFVRNYADKYHHQKEEDYLFLSMQEELGELANKLIKMGMLVEHDMGRLFMQNMEAAIEEYEKTKSVEAKFDILTFMGGYIDLIVRHATKENEVVFTFASRSLKAESKTFLDEETKKFEDKEENIAKRKYYEDYVNSL